VGARYNRYGKRLLLQVDEDRVCSVPPQWTDVVGLEPEIILGDGCAPLRLVDLIELADLIERLMATCSRLPRKPNYAAHVRTNTPLSSSELKLDPKYVCSKKAAARKRKLDCMPAKRRK
jgi:hypothetical protein